ncbi:MAG: hypothetical protein JNK15_14010, partial [Planctomycetes bacterium]|nr:hypothetical protein [Planctomycetota bacterium]
KVAIRLEAAPELVGRVLGSNGRPVAGLTLLPDCGAMARNGMFLSEVPLQPVAFDADGRFRFDGLNPRIAFRVLALLEPADARAAGLRLVDGVPLAPVLWLSVGCPPFAQPCDLGELRLDRMVVAQVHVRTANGTPVPGARLSVTTELLGKSPLAYVCDRVGRLQFPLPEGTVRIGAYAPGSGVATRLVQVPVPDGDPGVDPLVLTLSPTRTVRGVVVDGAGQPVAGVNVWQAGRAKGKDGPLAELAEHAAATSEPTGANGAFELVLPLEDAEFELLASGKRGDVVFSSERTTIAPDDDNLERLRIVVTPWQAKK